MLTEQSQGRKDPQPQAGSTPRPPLRVKCFLQTETSFQSASLTPTKGNETQHGGVTAMSGTNQNTAELGRSRSQCYMWYHRTGSKQGGVILTGGARRWCLRGNRRGWSSGHLTGFTELYSMNTPLGVGGWCLAGLTVCADQVPGGRGGRLPLGGQESHTVALGSLQNRIGLGDDALGAAVREAHAWAARLRAHGVRVHVCVAALCARVSLGRFLVTTQVGGQKESNSACLHPHPGYRKTSF